MSDDLKGGEMSELKITTRLISGILTLIFTILFVVVFAEERQRGLAIVIAIPLSLSLMWYAYIRFLDSDSRPKEKTEFTDIKRIVAVFSVCAILATIAAYTVKSKISIFLSFLFLMILIVYEILDYVETSKINIKEVDKMYKDEKASGALAAIGLIVIMLFIFVGLGALISSIASIDVGYGGVVFDKSTGQVSPEALTPGWKFVKPFTVQVITMETRIQKEQVNASAASHNLQTATTSIALNYYVAIDDLPWVYQNLGLDYKVRYVDQAIQDSVKASTAQFTAEELITKRETIRQNIETLLREKLAPKHIQVDAVSITNFAFSPDFQAAIEAKQTAEQLALKAENDLNRIKVEAEQTIATAKAEAQAIQIKGDALQKNPSLVQLEWVNKWNGIMPSFYVAGEGNTGGLLINVPSMPTGK